MRINSVQGKALALAIISETESMEVSDEAQERILLAVWEAMLPFLRADGDPSRCPYVATDPMTTRYWRADGWRCGHDIVDRHNHELFTTDGESVLYAGTWVLPEERERYRAEMGRH